MRDPYNQLIVANVILAVGAVVVCFGGPLVPALIGAGAGGTLLFVGRRLRRRVRSPDSAA
jgi:hypothetical protein